MILISCSKFCLLCFLFFCSLVHCVALILSPSISLTGLPQKFGGEPLFRRGGKSYPYYITLECISEHKTKLLGFPVSMMGRLCEIKNAKRSRKINTTNDDEGSKYTSYPLSNAIFLFIRSFIQPSFLILKCTCYEYFISKTNRKQEHLTL